MDWSMFGNMSALQNEIEEVSTGNVERVEVPFGDYEVRVTKCEVEACPFEGDYEGKPQLAVWFKIINNEEGYNGQLLFMTKRLWSAKSTRATAFLIKNAVDFLNSLEPSFEVKFDENFEDSVKEVFAEIGDGKAEYQLSYHEREAKNGKSYKEYDIVQKF